MKTPIFAMQKIWQRIIVGVNPTLFADASDVCRQEQVCLGSVLQRKQASSTLGSHHTSPELSYRIPLCGTPFFPAALHPLRVSLLLSFSISLYVPLLYQETTEIKAKAIKCSGKVITPHLTKLQGRGAVGHQGFHFTPCPEDGQLHHPFLLSFPSSCTPH